MTKSLHSTGHVWSVVYMVHVYCTVIWTKIGLLNILSQLHFCQEALKTRTSKSQLPQNLPEVMGRPKNVSPNKFSGNSGPQKEIVPETERPCINIFLSLCITYIYVLVGTYCVMHNDGDVSIEGHCVYGTIHFGDQGSEKNLYGDKSFRDVPSPHYAAEVLVKGSAR